MGDVTVSPAERLIALAGEGMLLPMMTDHNHHIDYCGDARRIGADRYFTPVIGNKSPREKLGHFNMFPVDAGAPQPEHAVGDWDMTRSW